MLADLFGLRHHVGGEQNRRAAAVLGENQVAELPRADRIQPAERLVQNQQIRLVQDRRDELHLLQHPLRQFFAALPFGAGETDAFERALNPLRQIGAVQIPSDGP